MKRLTIEGLGPVIEKSEIVAMGETHHGKHEAFFKKFDKHIPKFDGVFYEMPVSDQASIDYYIKTGELDDRLIQFIARAKKEGKDIEVTLTTILSYSRDHDLPIVAIDSSKKETDEYNKKSEHGNYYHKFRSREEDMFQNIIDKVERGKKYLLICGARHLVLGEHHRSGVDSLGTRLENQFNKKLVIIALVNKDQAMPDYVSEFDYILEI